MAVRTSLAWRILRRAGWVGPWATLLLVAALVPFCMGSGCYVPLYPSHRAVAVYDDDRSKEEVEQELADLRQQYADAKNRRRQANDEGRYWEYDRWDDRCDELLDQIIHDENVLTVWHDRVPERDVGRAAATAASRPPQAPAGTHVPATGACRCPPGR